MEFNIRRRKRDTDISYARKNSDISYLETAQNQTLASSPDTSYILAEPDIQTTIIDDQVRKKASLLLSLPISPRLSVNKKHSKISKRQIKLSLMHSPRKKITISINQSADILSKKRTFTRTKIGNFYQSRNGSENFYIPKSIENKTNFQLDKSKNLQRVQYNSMNKRNLNSYFSMSEYFTLVFSKLLSKSGNQKIYIFIQQLSQRYQKYPQSIMQDVIDMRAIASKLIAALGPKQNYLQLKPFEALQVNGELARLIFHLAHQITTKKYNNYDLIKIYKEIEFCARRLQLHKFTLNICFKLGQIYKQNYDELNSHAYFTKALKLSIFLNDKFHEEKAIDYFGINAYSSHKSAQAFYFHQNINKLNPIQRDIIKQKYANNDEIQKINIQRESLRFKGNQTSRNWIIFQKKKQKFNFNGLQYSGDYQMQNKKKFKQKIKEYIQCPVMRTNILVARARINKIDMIGQINRYKDWQASRIPIKFRGGEDAESSSQVLLTHKSLNRINPEYENKILEKQRKILLDLINYYTNDNILSVS